ncbi:MAG: histidinol-phosphate transaminase [Pseudomonadota bacterium]
MSKKTPASLMAPWLRDLKPYSVAEVSGLIKLDAMENPYVFPTELVDDWLATLHSAEINRYPDPHSTSLKHALATQLALPKEASITVGNGSDEIIHMLCLAFNQPGAKLLAPGPSFAVYPLAAKAVNMEYVEVPLDSKTFELKTAEFLNAIREHQPALIFLASPNNPTANRFADEDIREIAAQTDGLVVLDEAYWRFAGDNCVSRLFDLENIVFMHTLSKIGLAGIRLGALIGRAAWLEPLERVRMPYNVSNLTQATACFAIEHAAYFDAQIEKICASRTTLMNGLKEIGGLEVWPSATNFILFRVPGAAPEVHASLLKNGVAIKNLHGGHPSLENCLRVSVGTDEENGEFLRQLKTICSS